MDRKIYKTALIILVAILMFIIGCAFDKSKEDYDVLVNDRISLVDSVRKIELEKIIKIEHGVISTPVPTPIQSINVMPVSANLNEVRSPKGTPQPVIPRSATYQSAEKPVETMSVVDTASTVNNSTVNNDDIKDDTEDNGYQYSEAEKIIIARVVYAESRGECFEGQVAVAQTVINRFESGKFGKTVKRVATTPNQFAYSRKWNKQNMKAVEEAILKRPHPKNMFYFQRSKSKRWRNFKYYKRIGNHSFYLSSD